MTNLLELKGIQQTFLAKAPSDVDSDLRPGEVWVSAVERSGQVHARRCSPVVHKSDPGGEIRLQGEGRHPPEHARDPACRIIHQNFSTFLT